MVLPEEKFLIAEYSREKPLITPLLVAAILSALVCELLTLPQDAVRDWGNLNSLTMGIVLILASLVFRYGAELETKCTSGTIEKLDSAN